MISFHMIDCYHILSKRLRLKRKGLSNVTVVSITKKEYGFGVHFLVKIRKVFKSNILRMIKCDLLKLSVVWNFHNKKMCAV